MTQDYGVARVRLARPDDAAALAPRLRSADLQEIAALSTHTPEVALEQSIAHSKVSYAVELASGEVVALFGVAPTPEPRLGAVWLMGSDDLKGIRRVFLRRSKEWLSQLFKGFDLLGNYVDSRNTLHVEWLRWLGFRFLRSVPIGRNREAFFEFVKLPD